MYSWLFEFAASATATVTFFGIFICGVIFSAVSLLFGDHHDGGGDHDFGHDLFHGWFGGGDAHHDGADHSHDGHDGDAGSIHAGLLSIRGMALLATGFGGIGMITQIYTGKTLFSTFLGLLSGYVFALLILAVMRKLGTHQANSMINMEQAVGVEGVVTTSIPAEGYGEISFVLGGERMAKMAVSADRSVIRTGTRVRIEKMAGVACEVAPVVR